MSPRTGLMLGLALSLACLATAYGVAHVRAKAAQGTLFPQMGSVAR